MSSSKQETVLKLIKSFGNRWGVLLPIYGEYSKNRVIVSAEQVDLAQKKLARQHKKLIAAHMPRADEKTQNELTKEIVEADSVLLRNLLLNRSTVDQVRQEMQARLSPPPAVVVKEVLAPPVVEMREEPQVPSSGLALAVPPTETGTSPMGQEMEEVPVADVVVDVHLAEYWSDMVHAEANPAGEDSELLDASESALLDFLGVGVWKSFTDEELWKVAAVLALERIEGFESSIGTPMVNQSFINHLKEIDPFMNKGKAERLVRILKERAGNWFNDGIDDDMQY